MNNNQGLYDQEKAWTAEEGAKQIYSLAQHMVRQALASHRTEKERLEIELSEERKEKNSICDNLWGLQKAYSALKNKSNNDYYCPKCKGISHNQTFCINNSCPEQICCGKPLSECTCSHRTPSITIEEAKDAAAKKCNYQNAPTLIEDAVNGNIDEDDLGRYVTHCMKIYAQHSTPVKDK